MDIPLVTESDIQAIDEWSELAPSARIDQTHLAALDDLRIEFDMQLAKMQAHEQRHELEQHLTAEHLLTLQRIGIFARNMAAGMGGGAEKDRVAEIAAIVTALHARLVQAIPIA